MTDRIRKALSMATAGGLVCCALFPAVAFGQIKERGGVVVRADLKPPDAEALNKLGPGLSAASLSVYKCNVNGICQTPLLVTPGGAVNRGTPDKPVWQWDPSLCSVYWPYTQITVSRTKQPILRWVLVKNPTDEAIYAFNSSIGIQLVPKEDDPGYENDPHQDLHKPQFDKASGGTAFSWHNLNTRKRTISYVPVVYRLKNDRSVDVQCNAADPDVVNES